MFHQHGSSQGHFIVVFKYCALFPMLIRHFHWSFFTILFLPSINHVCEGIITYFLILHQNFHYTVYYLKKYPPCSNFTTNVVSMWSYMLPRPSDSMISWYYSAQVHTFIWFQDVEVTVKHHFRSLAHFGIPHYM